MCNYVSSTTIRSYHKRASCTCAVQQPDITPATGTRPVTRAFVSCPSLIRRRQSAASRLLHLSTSSSRIRAERERLVTSDNRKRCVDYYALTLLRSKISLPLLVAAFTNN